VIKACVIIPSVYKGRQKRKRSLPTRHIGPILASAAPGCQQRRRRGRQIDLSIQRRRARLKSALPRFPVKRIVRRAYRFSLKETPSAHAAPFVIFVTNGMCRMTFCEIYHNMYHDNCTANAVINEIGMYWYARQLSAGRIWPA
jgi:hypothetical protein